MSNLALTLACWSYDRTRALFDGRVRPDGIDLTCLDLPVEETFFRMLRHHEFDVAEMSLSSYVVSLFADDPPFVAIPVFPSRFFRHSCIYVHAGAGIARPEDLAGRTVGTPEYQMTAPVWIRGTLSDEHGVAVESVTYATGGLEEPGRPEKLTLELPAGIRVNRIPPDRTLSAMLAAGEIADAGGIDAVFVGEDAADPDRRGHLVFGHAEALADQVLRLADAALGRDEDAGVAEETRREDRDGDEGGIVAH